MLFKIKEIGDDGLSIDLPITAAWLASQCPDLDATPGSSGLGARGRLSIAGGDVFLRGSLQGTLQMSCSRCLEKAGVAIDVPLALTFIPRSEDDPGADAPGDEDVDVGFYDGEEVDLAPEIRDQILLALPITPLCREDCAGLCPVCGGNRNLVPCGCASRQSLRGTSLAAALQKLKT